MRITVRTLGGKSFDVSVDPAVDTVAAIKRKVEEEGGGPAAAQKLLLAGAELGPDARRASEVSGLAEGSVLHLLEKEAGAAAGSKDDFKRLSRKKSATAQGDWHWH